MHPFSTPEKEVEEGFILNKWAHLFQASAPFLYHQKTLKNLQYSRPTCICSGDIFNRYYFSYFLGLDEDSPRPMECFDFVCRAPTDFFKSRRLHPPLLRSQANLENLILAAEALQKGDPDKEHKNNSDITISCSNSDT